MSGHNTICVATCLVECGLLPEDRRERFVLEAPSGPVPIRTELAADGRCASVTFDGPPSFVAVRDEVVQLDPDACRALGLAAACLLYTSPSPRDATLSRMPSSA